VNKTRMKYFSYDKIPYLYDQIEDDAMLPFSPEESLDPELKIAG